MTLNQPSAKKILIPAVCIVWGVVVWFELLHHLLEGSPANFWGVVGKILFGLITIGYGAYKIWRLKINNTI